MFGCFCGKRDGTLGKSTKNDSKTLQPRSQGICIVTTEHTVGSHKKKYLVSIKRERIFIHSSSADLDKKPLGHISLDGSFLTVLTNTRFRIQSPNEKKTFFFTAPSVKERNEWLLGLAERKGLRRRAKDYYDLGKFMGSGSNCDVHECTHKLTKKVYAFKHMSKEKMDVKGRLYNELKILVHTSKYRHPGIVHMEDWFFDHDNRIVIIMELLTGGELFSRILAKRRFPEPEARSTTQEIVSALRYLHKRGIAHRDLKPENLIYENDDPGAALKIVDFDLSKFFHKTMRATTPCGTISYNAPEIVRREPYSQAVDIWSLGVVVYVLVSGRLPFSGRTDAEREKKIAIGKVNFPPAHWSHVSSTAKDFTARLLEPNPDLRPTIEEVANHPWLLEGIPIPETIFKPLGTDLPPSIMHPLKDLGPAAPATNGESHNGTPHTATTPYSDHSNYTPHRDTSYVKFNLDTSMREGAASLAATPDKQEGGRVPAASKGKAAEKVVEKLADEKPAENAAEKSAEKATERSVEKGSRKSWDKAGGKAAGEVVDDLADKAADTAVTMSGPKGKGTVVPAAAVDKGKGAAAAAAGAAAAPAAPAKHARKMETKPRVEANKPGGKRDSRIKGDGRGEGKGDHRGSRGGRGHGADHRGEGENEVGAAPPFGRSKAANAAHVHHVISAVSWLGGKAKASTTTLSFKRAGESSVQSPSSHKHHHKAANGQHNGSALQPASAPPPDRVSPPITSASESPVVGASKVLLSHALVDPECT
eukprot:jgi/Mesvir1/8344/Mv12605-RA.1